MAGLLGASEQCLSCPGKFAKPCELDGTVRSVLLAGVVGVCLRALEPGVGTALFQELLPLPLEELCEAGKELWFGHFGFPWWFVQQHSGEEQPKFPSSVGSLRLGGRCRQDLLECEVESSPQRPTEKSRWCSKSWARLRQKLLCRVKVKTGKGMSETQALKVIMRMWVGSCVALPAWLRCGRFTIGWVGIVRGSVAAHGMSICVGAVVLPLLLLPLLVLPLLLLALLGLELSEGSGAGSPRTVATDPAGGADGMLERLDWCGFTATAGVPVGPPPVAVAVGAGWLGGRLRWGHVAAMVAAADASRSPRYTWRSVSWAVAGMRPDGRVQMFRAHGKWNRLPEGSRLPAATMWFGNPRSCSERCCPLWSANCCSVCNVLRNVCQGTGAERASVVTNSCHGAPAAGCAAHSSAVTL